MSRYTRTKVMRKQAANSRRAWEKQLRRIRAELRADWRSGHRASIDTVSVIREAEQWQLKLKRRREERRRERRQERAAA